MNTHCDERDRLSDQYLAAVNAFGKAVSEMRARSHEEGARQLTQQASSACQYALKAVIGHERERGCGKTGGYAIQRLRNARAPGLHRPAEARTGPRAEIKSVRHPR